MKSSLCALAFMLLCTNHAFAFDTSNVSCGDIKVLASGYLNSATATAKLQTEAAIKGQRQRANELFEDRLQYLNAASSYSTIYATFCKP